MGTSSIDWDGVDDSSSAAIRWSVRSKETINYSGMMDGDNDNDDNDDDVKVDDDDDDDDIDDASSSLLSSSVHQCGDVAAARGTQTYRDKYEGVAVKKRKVSTKCGDVAAARGTKTYRDKYEGIAVKKRKVSPECGDVAPARRTKTYQDKYEGIAVKKRKVSPKPQYPRLDIFSHPCHKPLTCQEKKARVTLGLMSQSDLTISQGSQSTSKTHCVVRMKPHALSFFSVMYQIKNLMFRIKKVGQVIRDIKK
jgi:hypothetical protein